jgi:DNA-binding NarL/FixJ family response regulator
MGKTRILLADDHAMVMEAVRKLLEPEFEVVGIAHDGRKLLQLASQTRPDLVLLDLGMPSLNGFDAGQQLKKLVPATKIVVLTMNQDGDTADAALREWASGYLLKNSIGGSELAKAIVAVMNGKQYVSQPIVDRRNERFIRDPRMQQARALTYRQREVLQLLAEGLSMKEAAAELQIKTRTIAFHKYQIMEEYGLKNNSDLVRFAMKREMAMGTEIARNQTNGSTNGGSSHRRC